MCRRASKHHSVASAHGCHSHLHPCSLLCEAYGRLTKHAPTELRWVKGSLLRLWGAENAPVSASSQSDARRL